MSDKLHEAADRLLITDEEAMSWPIESQYFFCTECNRSTHDMCGYCGYSLCMELACIKAHASKGCYNNYRDADQSPTHVNPPQPPDARPSDYAACAVPESTVDAEAIEAEGLSERG